jgi:hypothetical protein
MAKLQVKCVVNEVYKSDKGNQYLTITDLSNGGVMKLDVSQGEIAVKAGDVVNMDLEVKGRVYNGKMSLSYLNGAVTK